MPHQGSQQTMIGKTIYTEHYIHRCHWHMADTIEQKLKCQRCCMIRHRLTHMGLIVFRDAVSTWHENGCSKCYSASQNCSYTVFGTAWQL